MRRIILPYWLLFCALPVLLVLVASLDVKAQRPPGWGWVNTLGGFVPNATQFNDVAGLGRDAAGNLYLFGTTAGTPPVLGAPAGSAAGSDMFLAKYSAAGVPLWWRTLQSSGDDKATALFVEPSGRCTLAGSFGGFTGDNLSFVSFGASAPPLAGPALLGLATSGGYFGALTFVAAVDASGALLWANTPSPAYGGVLATALHRDSSGNCYVSANTNPQGTLIVNGQNYPPIGTYDAVLLKYTPAGQVAWVRRVGATSGFTVGGALKTDAADALYWTIGHNRGLVIDGQAVPFITPSNPVTAGSSSLVKISVTNSVRWIKNGLLKAGGSNAQGPVLFIDQASNALFLQGGSFGGTVTDQSNSLSLPIPTNSFGTCIARCDTSGAVQWIKPFAYASTVPNGASWAAVSVSNFFPDASGYTALTNTAYSAQTVFPPANTFDKSRSGMPCVTRFSYATNQFEWIRVGGLTSNYAAPANFGSSAVASVIDGAGNVFVAGTFMGTAQFGTTVISTTSTSQPEIFLAKLDQSLLTATHPAGAGQTWALYPNPAPHTATLTGAASQVPVRVHDLLGRLVFGATTDADGTAVLRLPASLPAGLYLVRAGTGPAQRLVVE